MVDPGAIQRLEQVMSTPFKRITYTEAIELLEKAVAGGKKFEFPVSACMGLSCGLGLDVVACEGCCTDGHLANAAFTPTWP